MTGPDTPGQIGTASRIVQLVLIVSTFGACWFGMQAVHEFGHVIGAWLSRGRVSQVVLHPLTISRTDLSENPHPLVVVWAGPVFGCVLPLLLWVVVERLHKPTSFLARFFAGFCLIANGAYISIGSIDRVGDCGEMLKHGSAIWQLWLFGAVTIPTGFRLWHGLGPHFGLGEARSQVNRSAVMISLAAFGMLIFLGLIVGGK